MTDPAAAILEEELVGRPIPDLVLASTAGTTLRLADASLPDFVLFIYPRIARPEDPVAAEWLAIPGARGCTAESCEFRDLAIDYRDVGLSIYELSTQGTADQVRACERLHLPYPLLSDPQLKLQRSLGLPTFTFEGRQLYRRSTLVVRQATVAVAQLEISDAPSHPRELLARLQRDGSL